MNVEQRNEDPYASRSFEEFWPHYLAMHSRPETQIAHTVATASCAALIAAGIVTRHPLLCVLGPVVDHAIAQASHRVFERNRTMPWKSPVWHVRAELRLATRVLSGRLGRG